MKRLILSIIICLLIGAVINVLVAWGIALSVNPVAGENSGALRPTERYQWDVSTTSAFGTLRLSSRRHDVRTGVTNSAPENFIPFWSDFDEPLPDYRAEPGWIEYRECEARGWPMLSLRTHTEFLKSPDGTVREESGAWSISLPWGQWKLYPLGDTTKTPFKHDMLLPLRPIWTGLAINTLFYALPLWLLLFGVSAMRRHRRSKRGACPHCGYPRGKSDVCSECGARLPS